MKRNIKFKTKNGSIVFLEVEVTTRNNYPELTICGEFEGGHGQCRDWEPDSDLQAELFKIWETKHLKKVSKKDIKHLEDLLDDIESEQQELADARLFADIEEEEALKIIEEMNYSEPEKVLALAKEEDVQVGDLESISEEGGNRLSYGGREYLVCTDEEADQELEEECANSAWAFSPSFLAEYTGLSQEVFKALQPQCESSNDAVVSLIESKGDMEDFSQMAASADGRGHFLSRYDGNENEQTVNGTTYYLYRQ